eukprot:scaffold10334_cov54-Cyclotella_meneghiniana.AAC.10
MTPPLLPYSPTTNDNKSHNISASALYLPSYPSLSTMLPRGWHGSAYSRSCNRSTSSQHHPRFSSSLPKSSQYRQQYAVHHQRQTLDPPFVDLPAVISRQYID